MIVKRYNIILGREVQMDIPLTDSEARRINEGRENIQNIVPHLSVDQREFLISGLLPEQWDEVFPER